MAGTNSDPRAKRPQEDDARPLTFTGPALGALFASTVIAVVVALLDTDIGRELQEDLDAPARALVAAPVLLLATAVFVLSVLAMVLPNARRPLLRAAEIAGWLIPAWLVMAGMVLAGIAYALDRID